MFSFFFSKIFYIPEVYEFVLVTDSNVCVQLLFCMFNNMQSPTQSSNIFIFQEWRMQKRCRNATINIQSISSFTKIICLFCHHCNKELCIIFTESAPLGRFSHRVAMSMCLCHLVQFFLGLSWALRSHDQFQASHISPPPLPPPPSWWISESRKTMGCNGVQGYFDH